MRAIRCPTVRSWPPRRSRVPVPSTGSTRRRRPRGRRLATRRAAARQGDAAAGGSGPARSAPGRSGRPRALAAGDRRHAPGRDRRLLPSRASGRRRQFRRSGPAEVGGDAVQPPAPARLDPRGQLVGRPAHRERVDAARRPPAPPSPPAPGAGELVQPLVRGRRARSPPARRGRTASSRRTRSPAASAPRRGRSPARPRRSRRRRTASRRRPRHGPSARGPPRAPARVTESKYAGFVNGWTRSPSATSPASAVMRGPDGRKADRDRVLVVAAARTPAS